MERLLNNAFTKMWTGHIIDLVHLFPESTPALTDLKRALESCELQAYFVQETKHQLQNRLLQIGITTYKILSIYIKLIDVVKMIDPSTVMLEDISEPLKHFLLQR